MIMRAALLMLVPMLPIATCLAADSGPPLKAVIDAEDEKAWRRLAGMHLTADGRHFVYVINRAETDDEYGELVVRRVDAEIERRFRLMPGIGASASARVSRSGRWLAFVSDKTTVSVVEIESGKRVDLEASIGFEFTSDAKERVLVRRAAAGAAAGRHELQLYDLPVAQPALSIADVQIHALSPNGDRLAWAGARGIEVMDLQTGSRALINPTPSVSALSWSPRSGVLAALESSAAGSQVLRIFQGSRASRMHPVTLSTDIKPDAKILPEFTWHDDELGLFFQVKDKAGDPAAAGAATQPVIWRSSDMRLSFLRTLRTADWYYGSLQTGKAIRLEDEKVRVVEGLPLRGHYMLGSDFESYGWLNRDKVAGYMSTAHVRDFYRVDLRTGERKMLHEKEQIAGRQGLSVRPQLSLDGAFMLHQDARGDYIATRLGNGESRNLTEGLPTNFYWPENDPASGRQPRFSDGQGVTQSGTLLQGWTSDGRYVLISDYFDIWALPLKGGKALNLTGDGKQTHTAYVLVRKQTGFGLGVAEGSDEVDLSRPLWFVGTDLNGGPTRVFERNPGGTRLKLLHSDEASLLYLQAERSTVRVLLRTSSTDSSNAFRVDESGRPLTRLTDINPQQRLYTWPPPARFLRYRNSKGGERGAVLFLPVGFREGTRYPTIFDIYEKKSVGEMHVYRGPEMYSDNIERLQRRGYAVVLPDIIARFGEPGPAAADDVLAATRAAVESGVVDPDAMGLYGHSYGGYEVLFIATQSRSFKAIVSAAGISNLVSDCGGIYSKWFPKSSVCEFSQIYLGKPLSEAPQLYLDNSPVFHASKVETPILLTHGDADVAVSFSESVQMFNALRRLGKPAVLLQYRSEGHELVPSLQRESQERMAEFFDHFLRGKPEPDWWRGHSAN
jgi:dipeptidyl aminopeptidase/acylaminoacyl peptidase